MQQVERDAARWFGLPRTRRTRAGLHRGAPRRPRRERLIGHVFGGASSPALWRPLLRSVLKDQPGLTLRADGVWTTRIQVDEVEFPAEFVVLDVETTGLEADSAARDRGRADPRLATRRADSLVVAGQPRPAGPSLHIPEGRHRRRDGRRCAGVSLDRADDRRDRRGVAGRRTQHRLRPLVHQHGADALRAATARQHAGRHPDADQPACRRGTAAEPGRCRRVLGIDSRTVAPRDARRRDDARGLPAAADARP